VEAKYDPEKSALLEEREWEHGEERKETTVWRNVA
jgi:hypothetical protein